MKRIRKVVDSAEGALDRHTEPAHPPGRKYAPPEGGDDPDALREEQAAETAQPVTAGGPPHMTNAQWKGMVLGGLAGGLIGALLFLPVALIPFIDAVIVRIVVVAIIGWLAGATAGAVYWGGRAPELEGETMDVNGRPSIGTTLRDPHTDERGR